MEKDGNQPLSGAEISNLHPGDMVRYKTVMSRINPPYTDAVVKVVKASTDGQTVMVKLERHLSGTRGALPSEPFQANIGQIFPIPAWAEAGVS